MMWSVTEVEATSMKSPGLAIGIAQLQVQRSAEFSRRIEGFSVDNVACRLADCLIRFCKRLGSPSGNGFVQILPVTHQFLSQYVGTSREIITHYMNYFRRRGYLRYSRRETFVDCDALQDWCRNPV
jgi:CRP-like cAMP-binding protein